MDKRDNIKPIIIAGPCSAESREQTINTALALAKMGKIDIFRAGVWKPRTKPGSFAGVGTKGLAWMCEARNITSLPIMTEVATSRHVEEALDHDIDALWIGARTTSNPFSMQEIAESLRGCNKPIFVKNPINTDIELWSGAIERLMACGITDITLIHRGFSSYGAWVLRNAPMWHIALEMKRRMPELPMICDPSHICGRREFLAEISQQASDLGYDGLMIESHISPDKAKSDAEQQITPAELEQLLEGIKWRSSESQSIAYQNELEALRGRIDQLDGEIFRLLADRMNAAEQIGRIKRDNNVMILQSSRWNSVVKRVLDHSESLGLSREFLRTLLDAIHIESIERQNRVMKEQDIQH